jgi:hypothetical protein
MRRSVRQAMLAAAVLGLMAAAPGQMRAGTIVNFSYSGRGAPDNAGVISTGSGTFSFASGLATVGLADLASFNFVLEENTPNTTTFGLADLTSFSAAVGPGPTLTSLALQTDAVQGSNQTTYPREFTISSLDPGGASSQYVFLGLPFFWTSGTVTITSVSLPEPSSLTLAVVGAVIVAGGWSRRRKARASTNAAPPQRSTEVHPKRG